MKLKKVFFIFFIFVFFWSFVFAQEDFSLEESENCLNNSQLLLEDLKEKGFETKRVEDLIEKAELIHFAQKEKRNFSRDFSAVKDYCLEIEEIHSFAIESKDEFSTLKKFYDLSYEQGMDNKSSLSILNEIEKEIENERYEKVFPLVEKGYQEISSMVDSYSALTRFYSSAALGIVTFFQENWKIVSYVVFSLIFLFFVFRKKIKKKILKKKIKRLELRKYSLGNYFKDVQRKYFDKNLISQKDYLVRSENYAKMVLELDRKIAIYNKELASLKPKKFRK